MPQFTSKEPLYTDLDPTGPVAGKVLKENDPGARFVLCGAGGVVPDDIAKKFSLEKHPDFEEHDEVTARAELVAANLATYEENARTFGGPAYKGIPGAEINPLGVKPDEIDKAQTALDGIANQSSSPFAGIDPRAAKALQDAGIDTLEKLATTPDDDLVKLPYITEATLPKLHALTTSNNE